ncbi:MAG TPA: methylated-DNA--[protein]-cysteine S-methyltransferase [Solirubrobacteraceae bacterium]|jgi:methylated-DNA-[protein]-cysteine S-methyltransferase|nr:methylated-DNA--[protein]-cysteine S-methyltransferase [Solirubrobacteraceae bacterium]
MTEMTIDAPPTVPAGVASTAWTSFVSPLGTFTLAGKDGKLQRLYFPSEAAIAARELAGPDRDAAAFADARAQLEQYFAGERRSFELALEPRASELQRRVWHALEQIRYGETTTYGAIARELGVPADGHDPPARIVGAAIARTPIPIVIPCHRVLAADGALRGYRGGLEVKRALLDFEASGGQRAALAEDWERDQLSLL